MEPISEIFSNKISNWLSKSEVSLKIASNESSELLNNRVHCYYYASLQYILHILHNNFGMSVEQISHDSNPKNNIGNLGSHLWLKNQILNDLKKNTFKLDSIDLNNHLDKLKKLRISADYGYHDIDNESLTTAKISSAKIQNILKKRYHGKP